MNREKAFMALFDTIELLLLAYMKTMSNSSNLNGDAE